MTTIKSKPPSSAYDSGWDRIFGRRQYVAVDLGSSDMTATATYEVGNGKIRVLDVKLIEANLCNDPSCPYYGKHRSDACAHYVDKEE